jgi:hypothetical protein
MGKLCRDYQVGLGLIKNRPQLFLSKLVNNFGASSYCVSHIIELEQLTGRSVCALAFFEINLHPPLQKVLVLHSTTSSTPELLAVFQVHG